MLSSTFYPQERERAKPVRAVPKTEKPTHYKADLHSMYTDVQAPRRHGRLAQGARLHQSQPQRLIRYALSEVISRAS
ncbi:MAG: hypothetical protein R3B07_27600 [Polyangiaceae bacterium]